MSVNPYLLPITDEELTDILAVPETVRRVVERQEAEVYDLSGNAAAIMMITTEDAHDQRFILLQDGAPKQHARHRDQALWRYAPTPNWAMPPSKPEPLREYVDERVLRRRPKE